MADVAIRTRPAITAMVAATLLPNSAKPLMKVAADRLTGSHINRDVRTGDKPSDHVPVWVELAD